VENSGVLALRRQSALVISTSYGLHQQADR